MAQNLPRVTPRGPAAPERDSGGYVPEPPAAPGSAPRGQSAAGRPTAKRHRRDPVEPRPGSEPEPLWRQALGERLRRLRHERGEKLAETSGRAGLSPQYLSEIERGVKEPSSEMIAAVAGALDTTLLELTSAIAHDLRAAPCAPRAAVRQAANRSTYALAA